MRISVVQFAFFLFDAVQVRIVFAGCVLVRGGGGDGDFAGNRFNANTGIHVFAELKAGNGGIAATNDNVAGLANFDDWLAAGAPAAASRGRDSEALRSDQGDHEVLLILRRYADFNFAGSGSGGFGVVTASLSELVSGRALHTRDGCLKLGSTDRRALLAGLGGDFLLGDGFGHLIGGGGLLCCISSVLPAGQSEAR